MNCFSIRFVFLFMLGPVYLVTLTLFAVCVFPLCYCLIVSTSAINCLERLVSEMTCYISSIGMLNEVRISKKVFRFEFVF